MRPPPHPLVLAAVLGAATGAVAAWLLEGTQGFEPVKPAAPQLLTTRSASSPRQDAGAVKKVDSSKAIASAAVMLPPPPLADAAAAARASQNALAAVEPAAGNPLPRPTASAEANTEVEHAFSAILWDKAADVVDADKSCVTGNPIACLELADHEDSIQAFGKSRAHRERAYAILVLQCHHREPDACVTIARMHALGLGIARDAASERALFARAKNLCKSRQGKVCAAMNP